MGMAILALDLGTKTGFALSQNGSTVSGTQDFSPKRYESSAMRFMRFERFLTEMFDKGEADPIAHVVFEEVRSHAGTTAAHVYGGFLSHLQVFCERRGVPLEAYPVGAIKKHWTGRGNASKEAMVEEAARRGFLVEDDNQADALAMLHMANGGV